MRTKGADDDVLITVDWVDEVDWSDEAPSGPRDASHATVKKSNTAALLVAVAMLLIGITVYSMNHDHPTTPSPTVIPTPVPTTAPAYPWQPPTAQAIGNTLGFSGPFTAVNPGPGIESQAQLRLPNTEHAASMVYVFRYASEDAASAEIQHMKADAASMSGSLGVSDGFIQCGPVFFLAQGIDSASGRYWSETTDVVGRELDTAWPRLEATLGGPCRVSTSF